ncbi:MAG TPA: DMT family transporter [Alphaproteobacteria bacterium]|nr:DMT family transporter [Alphaproteobacteria bacterium]
MTVVCEKKSNLQPATEILAKKQKPIVGALLVVATMFLFSTCNAMFKGCEQSYALSQVVFFRNLFAFIPFMLFLKSQGGVQAVKPKAILPLFLRALFGVICLGLLFKSLKMLPFADATVLTFSSSLFIAVLSGPFLKEKVGFKEWLCVVLGFLGVVVMARPGGETDALSSTLALGLSAGILAAFLDGALIIQGRFLSKTETTASLVFSYALFSCLLCGVALPFVWITPTSQDWLRLAFLGIGGGLGQYLMTYAYSITPATLMGGMIYSSMIWSVVYGVFLFDESLSSSLIFGGGLIVLSGFYLVFLKKGEN